MAKKQDIYIYPAILYQDDDGIAVEFPDLPGCLTFGEDQQEAIKSAKEALALHMYGIEQDEEEIPEPSSIFEIKLNLQEKEKAIITLIEVVMPMYRDAIETKSVKKTLTIPFWLNEIAVRHNINFSKALVEGLKRVLNIQEEGREGNDKVV